MTLNSIFSCFYVLGYEAHEVNDTKEVNEVSELPSMN